MLTLGSLFDGIGGWLLAAQHAGVEPIWSSEIEPFPCAVTAKHFPDTLQLGDITKLDGAELPPVDIVCAGSPCQDLSVAGKQEGLKGERSGLFRDAIRLVRDMRRASGGQAPRFFVWENVPGAFSSNKGMDFRAVLEEITETSIPMPPSNKWADAGMVEWDGGSLAWRILDAQYWGVPQRRRRIFLVVDFRGRSAGEILFERAGVCGDIAAGGETRKGTAGSAESGIDGAIGVALKSGALTGNTACALTTEGRTAGATGPTVYIPDKARTITARNDGSPCVDRGPDVVAVYDMTHADEVMRKVPDGRAPTLNARMGTGGNQVPVISYAIAGNTIDRQIQNGGNGKGVLAETSYTLNTVDRHAVAAVDCRNGTEGAINGTLQAKPNGGTSLNLQNVVRVQKTVRRLTPLECERLQGLPDGYTLINDKSCSDSARYKALGNGMAQPCADYVIRRIVEVMA